MQSNLHSTNITPLKQLNNNTKTSTSDWRDTLNGVSRQFYSPLASSIAYAVIFGYRRVIFATRVLWRIEYHCEAKPNNITARRAISLFAKQRISLIESRKERVMRKCTSVKLSLLFLLPVSHLFNKRLGLCPYPTILSPIRTSPIFRCACFCPISREAFRKRFCFLRRFGFRFFSEAPRRCRCRLSAFL